MAAPPAPPSSTPDPAPRGAVTRGGMHWGTTPGGGAAASSGWSPKSVPPPASDRRQGRLKGGQPGRPRREALADVVMPRLSDSMEEGTILQWLKQVGDEISVGDELVEIETDKANMAYESDVAGKLTEILVQEDETVPIGTPIARVGR